MHRVGRAYSAIEMDLRNYGTDTLECVSVISTRRRWLFKQNSKLLWKIINEIVSRKPKKGGSITHLKSSNDEILYNPKDIANELNKYFVEIGKKLSEKIAPTEKKHQDYLKGQPIQNTFFLAATNPFEIESIISSFNNNTGYGTGQFTYPHAEGWATSIIYNFI